MGLFTKLNVSVVQSREIEDMKAKLLKQEAIIDYISIMTDIEIPEDTENGDG